MQSGRLQPIKDENLELNQVPPRETMFPAPTSPRPAGAGFPLKMRIAVDLGVSFLSDPISNEIIARIPDAPTWAPPVLGARPREFIQ
jgi:hypothetical protein